MDRRDFLKLSGLAAGLTIVPFLDAACAIVPTAQLQDGDLVNRVLTVEDVLNDYWSRALPHLGASSDAATLVQQIAAEDRTHVALLEGSLSSLRTARTARRQFDYPAGTFNDAQSTLRQGLQLATLAAGAYLGAISLVRRGQVRELLASCGAVEGRHRVLLRRASGSLPVMDAAFETAGNMDTLNGSVQVFYKYA